jgi:hypothetical protein
MYARVAEEAAQRRWAALLAGSFPPPSLAFWERRANCYEEAERA